MYGLFALLIVLVNNVGIDCEFGLLILAWFLKEYFDILNIYLLFLVVSFSSLNTCHIGGKGLDINLSSRMTC